MHFLSKIVTPTLALAGMVIGQESEEKLVDVIPRHPRWPYLDNIPSVYYSYRYKAPVKDVIATGAQCAEPYIGYAIIEDGLTSKLKISTCNPRPIQLNPAAPYVYSIDRTCPDDDNGKWKVTHDEPQVINRNGTEVLFLPTVRLNLCYHRAQGVRSECKARRHRFGWTWEFLIPEEATYETEFCGARVLDNLHAKGCRIRGWDTPGALSKCIEQPGGAARIKFTTKSVGCDHDVVRDAVLEATDDREELKCGIEKGCNDATMCEPMDYGPE